MSGWTNLAPPIRPGPVTGAASTLAGGGRSRPARPPRHVPSPGLDRAVARPPPLRGRPRDGPAARRPHGRAARPVQPAHRHLVGDGLGGPGAVPVLHARSGPAAV